MPRIPFFGDMGWSPLGERKAKQLCFQLNLDAYLRQHKLPHTQICYDGVGGELSPSFSIGTMDLTPEMFRTEIDRLFPANFSIVQFMYQLMRVCEGHGFWFVPDDSTLVITITDVQVKVRKADPYLRMVVKEMVQWVDQQRQTA